MATVNAEFWRRWEALVKDAAISYPRTPIAPAAVAAARAFVGLKKRLPTTVEPLEQDEGGIELTYLDMEDYDNTDIVRFNSEGIRVRYHGVG